MESIQMIEAWLLKGADYYTNCLHFLGNDITGQQYLGILLVFICISVVISAIMEAKAKIRVRTESRYQKGRRPSGPPILVFFVGASLFWPFVAVIGLVLLPGVVGIYLLYLLYKLVFRISADEKALEEKEEITVTIEDRHETLVRALVQDNVSVPSLSALLFSKSRRERVIAKQLLRVLHKD